MRLHYGLRATTTGAKKKNLTVIYLILANLLLFPTLGFAGMLEVNSSNMSMDNRKFKFYYLAISLSVFW